MLLGASPSQDGRGIVLQLDAIEAMRLTVASHRGLGFIPNGLLEMLRNTLREQGKDAESLRAFFGEVPDTMDFIFRTE